MQKFKVELKNEPMDAPLVRSSSNSQLNRDQSLSVEDKVLTLNNLKVDPLQHRGGQNPRVYVIAYVLNQRGEPLMPCSPRKARILIKKGEAIVIKTNPFFVIQLKKATGEQVQKCSLGIDSGSKKIGFSVITDLKEIVAGELALDLKTSERLTERRMCHKNKRRRLWYRQPRFNNRTRWKGWLPPSFQRKLDTHVTLINRLKKLLPINRLTVEVGNFDTQKIENPDIKGLQYQYGSLYEYYNMRSFLLTRENGLCQLCEKTFSKGNPSHIHHLISRKHGGTDREKNLALLHEKCHIKLHKTKAPNSLKKNRDFKDASFMNSVKWKFAEIFPDCLIVFGNETFVKRNELRLEKSHCNDAFVIAGGTNQVKSEPVFMGQKHRNGRILQLNRRGFGISIRRKRHAIQPFDIITVDNKNYVVKGCHSRGKEVVCTDGTKKFNFNIKKVKKAFHVGSIFSVIPKVLL